VVAVAKLVRERAPVPRIDAIDGTPNPLLQRWLSHPSYDRYWQAMVPYKGDFAHINIPVLSITGYYDDAQISAMQYFRQHTELGRNPEHYLVIGPYDHLGTHWRKKPEPCANTPSIRWRRWTRRS
jgi:predicted acyl esterase